MSLDLSSFKFRSTSKLKDRLDLVEDLFYRRKSHSEVASILGITRSGVTHFVRRLELWVEEHPGKDSVYRAMKGKREGLEDFSGEMEEFKEMHKELIKQLGEMVTLIDLLDADKRRPQWYDVRLRAMKMLRDFMADYWDRFGHYVEDDKDGENINAVLQKRIDGFMDFLEKHSPQSVGAFIDYLDGVSSDSPEDLQSQGQG